MLDLDLAKAQKPLFVWARVVGINYNDRKEPAALGHSCGSSMLLLFYALISESDV